MSANDGPLAAYGWSAARRREYDRLVEEAGLDAGRCQPARAVRVIRSFARLAVAGSDARDDAVETDARIPGRLRVDRGERPAVGDWTVLEAAPGTEGVVQAILPRASKLSRKVAGARTEEQVLAANVDTVFLVMGLDGDYNLRRLERLAVAAHQSGAEPVVVLTKADVLDAEALRERRDEVTDAAPGVPVFPVSSVSGLGLEPLRLYLEVGQTVVLLGSSGVGKSTLLNTLVGREVMKTGEVREGDDRGKHTTTHRELVLLPGGGLLIDGPGLREMQLWLDEDPDDALADAFTDIEEFAAGCRFRDCTHHQEPGCAVRGAVEAGELEGSRLGNYHALQKELVALERKKDVAADRQFFKKQGKLYKRIQGEKKGRRR
ncbi:MAG TPA: ribosome small subunit-dependent GTPase A [Thermoanaerobaculia bacterium]|nr:ribosome small subunit-dependent GTPase A [Thermoanaerobaculia bacterium]